MAKVLSLDFEQPQTRQQALREIQSVLDTGGVAAFPTDTFYGLGADPFNEAAVSKIFALKKRAADQPLLVLIHSVTQCRRLATDIPAAAQTLMDRFWPGPLTLLFPASPDLPEALTAGSGKIGLRLPADPFAHQLLAALDRPLTAPSANLSGQKELRSAQEVLETFGEDLDVIIDGGLSPGGKVSTVLDATTHPPTLLREGAVARGQLETVLPVQSL